MTDTVTKPDKLAMVTKIVAAYVSKNNIPPEQLSELITTVHGALGADSQADIVHRDPAVPIKKSVKPDYIVCLEDGRKLKMLKRHLRNAYNMTPEDYRARWSLPQDYPMVAPKYAAKRSELAKKIGLGSAPKARRKKKKNAAN